jgi:hypothetical protein
MIAQAVPLVAVEVRFQRRAQLLLRLVVRREIVIEKGQQILLRGSVLASAARLRGQT